MRLGAEVSFRWVSPDAKEHTGSKAELEKALTSGLPPQTLVWSTGWGEWLPANRVAALAHALPPGTAAAPVEPAQSLEPHRVPPRPASADATGAFAPVAAGARPGKVTRPQMLPPRIVLPSERKMPVPKPEAPAAKPEAAAPSSFGVLGGKPPAAPSSSPFASPKPPSPFEGSSARYDGGPRPPMPTLSEEAQPATATLRPPGAMPPPARGAAPSGPLHENPIERFSKGTRAEDTPLPVPGAAAKPTSKEPEEVSADEVELSWDDSAPTKKRSVAPAGAAQPLPTVPPPPAPPPPLAGRLSSRPPSELAGALVRPSAPSGAPAAGNGRSSTAPATGPFDSTMSSEHLPASAITARFDLSEHPMPAPGSHHPPLDAAPQPKQSPEALRRLQLTVYALGGVCALLAIAAVALLASRESRVPVQQSTSASASAAPLAALTGCRVSVHPARLAATVERSVLPLIATREVSGKVALGFAESPKKALGLLLDPATLDAEKSFERSSERAIKSVVPLVSSGTPTFALDADGGTVKNGRTVDAKLPFTLGLAEAGIARVVSSTPELVWPLTSTNITEPRVASVPEGHAVTFRDGGLEGKIMLGWLKVDGAKSSEVAAIPGPRFVGTPFVAAGKQGFLVTFAARANSNEAWRVELASGAPMSTKAERVTFGERPGGLGGGQIAPSVAPIGESYWLLQWTEGKTGMYQVRTQLLGSKLEPIGEALVVSPKGASSGQGSLYTVGSRAISLYVQTIGGHDELWATTLDCR